MPVNRPVALRNARLIVDRDAIDAGTGPGVLQIGTTGMAVVLADARDIEALLLSGAL